ncbi:hypothetical protein GCM10007301_35330 [Azorhizobium oxalatiphilum]|uniref:Uncharacterized protein n=1 Tax=Azorhizobium oxalatiphilum TaxID=980631 RepID=A0A917FES1_9HYPH|nr:HEAT repeat domain-containing protein [Azorhizobium oxalatiphilum]GGF72446.1 hypothetical protein GCM10007301_35330 [Azorhizobium oxalatiphilum]
MNPAFPDPAAFWRLREAPLHAMSAAEFDVYYPQMAQWLGHEDATIRPAAVERLCMATFRGEPLRGADRDDAKALARLAWLLGEIETAALAHRDVLAAFLSELRWHGDDAPFRDPVVAWLDALSDDARFRVARDRITAAKVLVGGFGRGAEARPALVALLDDPSDYVRACAAHRLPETFDGEPFLPFLDWLREKEIERPGIFGPFWGGFAPDADDVPFERSTYLLDIVARRSGPEPDDMPFNGVDFYLHEVAGNSPAVVRRLMELGEYGTAIMTATEEHEPIEGMAEVLAELGEHENEALAGAAHMHLAMVYGIMHDHANPRVLRHWLEWQPGVDAFAVRQGNGEHWRDVVVLHPAQGAAPFDTATAWRLIDLALPPAVRGEEVRHKLTYEGMETLAFILGPNADHAFASGALVTLTGTPPMGPWERLTLIGRGLQKTWAPLDWA